MNIENLLRNEEEIKKEIQSISSKHPFVARCLLLMLEDCKEDRFEFEGFKEYCRGIPYPGIKVKNKILNLLKV